METTVQTADLSSEQLRQMLMDAQAEFRGVRQRAAELEERVETMFGRGESPNGQLRELTELQVEVRAREGGLRRLEERIAAVEAREERARLATDVVKHRQLVDEGAGVLRDAIAKVRAAHAAVEEFERLDERVALNYRRLFNLHNAAGIPLHAPSSIVPSVLPGGDHGLRSVLAAFRQIPHEILNVRESTRPMNSGGGFE